MKLFIFIYKIWNRETSRRSTKKKIWNKNEWSKKKKNEPILSLILHESNQHNFRRICLSSHYQKKLFFLFVQTCRRKIFNTILPFHCLFKTCIKRIFFWLPLSNNRVVTATNIIPGLIHFGASVLEVSIVFLQHLPFKLIRRKFTANFRTEEFNWRFTQVTAFIALLLFFSNSTWYVTLLGHLSFAKLLLVSVLDYLLYSRGNLTKRIN